MLFFYLQALKTHFQDNLDFPIRRFSIPMVVLRYDQKLLDLVSMKSTTELLSHLLLSPDRHLAMSTTSNCSHCRRVRHRATVPTSIVHLKQHLVILSNNLRNQIPKKITLLQEAKWVRGKTKVKVRLLAVFFVLR